MTNIQWDWMACSSIVNDTGTINNPQLGMPAVTAPNSPYASGSMPIYQGLIVDPYGNGIPAANISALTLSIVDVLTQEIILPQTNILNTGRGSVDAAGNLTINLLASDTAMTEVPGAAQVERAMIIDWTYANTGPMPPASSGSGRHQVNFIVQALSGP